MVDIHSHILPGLDDGSPDLETSLAMLRMAAAGGTTDIVASPHANHEYAFQPAAVREKLDTLQSAAGDLIRLHTACDFHLEFDNIQDALANPAKYTINHHRYLLVEFPEIFQTQAMSGALETLIQAGLVPILTHPERNYQLRDMTPLVRQWVEAGCLVQVTAQSLTGFFGSQARKVSEQWMDLGLVHFLASDAHDPVSRHPKLDEVRAHVAGRWGEKTARRLLESNPRATLTGAAIDAVAPAPKHKLWGLFSR